MYVNKDKLKYGGIYLVNLKGYVSPEFGFNHYCILLKTDIKDLYLVFLLPLLKIDQKNLLSSLVRKKKKRIFF